MTCPKRGCQVRVLYRTPCCGLMCERCIVSYVPGWIKPSASRIEADR